MPAASESTGRGRKIAGTVLISLGAVLMLAAGTAKLAHASQFVAQMSALGLDSSKLTFVGFLEVVSGLLFLIPLTRSFGLLMVSSFFGGAIATHLEHGQSIAPPAIVLALIWLGAWLRHPVILWSWRRGNSSAQAPSPQRIAQGA